MDNNTALFKWVKASERLPENGWKGICRFDGEDIEKSVMNNGRLCESEILCIPYNYPDRIEWLEEHIPLAAQPVDSSHSDKDVQDKMYSIIHEEITQARIKIDPMLNDHKNYNNADDIIADSVDKIFEKLAALSSPKNGNAFLCYDEDQKQCEKCKVQCGVCERYEAVKKVNQSSLGEAAQPQQPKETAADIIKGLLDSIKDCTKPPVHITNRLNDAIDDAEEFLDAQKEQPKDAEHFLSEAYDKVATHQIKKASENWREIDPDKFLSEIRG